MRLTNKIYHIYNRGNHKDLICFEEEDFDYLLKVIYESFSSLYYDIISVCIMPNHFHLLIAQTQERPIWVGMHRIGTLYAKYINKKYERTGHLWEDSYKRKYVSNFIYFRNLLGYIRENPKELEAIHQDTFRLKENIFLQEYYNVELTYPNE